MAGNVAAQHSIRTALKAARKKDPKQQQQQQPDSMQLLPKAYLTVTKTLPNLCKAQELRQWWDQTYVAQAQFVRQHDLVGGP